MWGRKKEDIFISTHLYLGTTPCILTGRCAGHWIEVIKQGTYSTYLDWVEKKRLEPIYECPEHDKG